MDWSQAINATTVIEGLVVVGDLGAGAGSGMATRGHCYTGTAQVVTEGMAKGAGSRIAKKCVSFGLKSECLAAVDWSEAKFLESGLREGVALYVKIVWKSCEPCTAYLNPFLWWGSQEYEWTTHEWPQHKWYQCSVRGKRYTPKGSVQPRPGLHQAGQRGREGGRYEDQFENAEHAQQHDLACIEEAVREFSRSIGP
jgi:hypothetical protein